MGRRKKRYYRKGGVHAFPIGAGFGGGGATRESVLLAALVIAEAVRKSAGRYSRRIPRATEVQEADTQMAAIVVNPVIAPQAVPWEFNERHPGNYPNLQAADIWAPAIKGQPGRPFFSRTVRSKAVQKLAGDIYLEREYELLKLEKGFTESL